MLRFPALLDDEVVFVTDDDLWAAPLGGGSAERLTALRGRPDHLAAGAGWIAFCAREDGPREVYALHRSSGELRRLTHDGGVGRVCAVTDDGEVVFSSSRYSPFMRDERLFMVSLAGGPPRPLGLGPAVAWARAPDGRVALGRDRVDLSGWRGYRGGRRGVVWLNDEPQGPFRAVRGEYGLATPCWADGQWLAVADPDGDAELVALVGDSVALRTAHGRGRPVRHLQSDGRRAVYCAGADVFVWDEGRASPIPVRVASPRLQRRPKRVSARQWLDDAEPHDDGARAAFIVRGQPSVGGLWEGPVTRLGRGSGTRYASPRWLDDDRLLLVADRGSSVDLEVHPIGGGPAVSLAPLPDAPLVVVPAPDGGAAFVVDTRGRLWRLPTDGSGATCLVDGPRVLDVDVSPDGAWLVWSAEVERRGGPTRLWLRGPDDRVVPLTSGRYRDRSPSFDPDGRYLYFLSYREFDPVYDMQLFDLGFPRGSRPYALTLAADTPDPFVSAPSPLRPPTVKPRVSAPGAWVTIDVDGIDERLAPFPVQEARYHEVIGIPGGKVLMTRTGVVSGLSRRMYDPGPERAERQLVLWEHEKQEATLLNSKVSSIRVSRSRAAMTIRSGSRLRGASTQPDKAARDELKKTEGPAGRPAGFVDLDRFMAWVDPPEEWRQMLLETARLQRDHTWEGGLSLTDVDEAVARASAELARVGTRSGLSDLLTRVQGDLGLSHAYEVGGDFPSVPSAAPGALGVDVSPVDDGLRIDRVIVGDVDDPQRRSPLRGPGVHVEAGDVILGVDGVTCAGNVTVGEALLGRAGAPVQLELRRGERRFSASVVALADERPLRARSWVLDNRDKVARWSGGRLGYLHVPNMGPSGYAEFVRDFAVEHRRDGLVIDLRHNTGGHVGHLLLEHLQRRAVGEVHARGRSPTPWPSRAAQPNMVCLVDAYTSSDADIFAYLFRRLGLGPCVGVQTWGGTIGVVPRHYLADRTLVTQPEFAHWFHDVGFGLENRGVTPDVVVDVGPLEDDDAPLRRAVDEWLRGQ